MRRGKESGTGRSDEILLLSPTNLSGSRKEADHRFEKTDGCVRSVSEACRDSYRVWKEGQILMKYE